MRISSVFGSLICTSSFLCKTVNSVIGMSNAGLGLDDALLLGDCDREIDADIEDDGLEELELLLLGLMEALTLDDGDWLLLEDELGLRPSTSDGDAELEGLTELEMLELGERDADILDEGEREALLDEEGLLEADGDMLADGLKTV